MTSHEMLSILVMLNNFFHDLAVGVLFANILLTLLLARLIKDYAAEHSDLPANFVRLSARITWGALVFIIIGGIIRTIAYRDFEWAEAAGKGQVAALIVKHVLLVGCTAVGIGLQIRMSRKYRSKDRGRIAGKGEQTAC